MRLLLLNGLSSLLLSHLCFFSPRILRLCGTSQVSELGLFHSGFCSLRLDIRNCPGRPNLKVVAVHSLLISLRFSDLRALLKLPYELFLVLLKLILLRFFHFYDCPSPSRCLLILLFFVLWLGNLLDLSHVHISSLFDFLEPLAHIVEVKMRSSGIVYILVACVIVEVHSFVVQ